jgi:PIN domain nuclease of toxin-antitoxin system
VSDAVYVLDASALLAALFGEAGTADVEKCLSGSRISAVNWSEVIAKLSDRGLASQGIMRDLAELDVVICDHDRRQAEAAGLLRDRTKCAGLSLGDRACLALAQSMGGIAVTADRAWGKLDLGIPIHLIR